MNALQEAPDCAVSTEPDKDTLTIKIPGNVLVSVSSDIHQMTSYVLLEQEDWFEDEMAFVRRLTQAGTHALDIGANHGVYSLAMAAQMEGRGKIWAIEPASYPGAHLRRSTRLNGFESLIEVIKAALSDHEGEMALQLGGSSELNSLHAGSGSAHTEMVPLRTLDSLMPEFGEAEIDFIKLDAEGEELRILAAAQAFFARHSPLVMFELKHGPQVNFGLIDAFKERGFDIYYYVPGLDALCPVGDPQGLDPYTLNLFACRPDRAASLRNRGFLLVEEPGAEDFKTDAPDWFASLCDKPYAMSFIGDWTVAESHTKAEHPLYGEALAQLLSFEDSGYDLSVRLASGRRAKHLFERLIETGDTTVPVLTAYVRVLRGLGYRAGANNVVGGNLDILKNPPAAHLARPWLPPESVTDMWIPRAPAGPWLGCRCLEFLERNRTLSSYFTPSTELLTEIAKTGFHSVAMDRRLALRSVLSGKSVRIRPDSRLLKDGGNGTHRNAEAWQTLAKVWAAGAKERRMSSDPGSADSAGLRRGKLESLSELLGAATELVRVVDIGASSHGKGTEPYAPLVQRGLAEVIGFEPNEEECKKVQANHGPTHRFLPCFVGTGKSATYYETNWVQTGSLYRPNDPILKAFTGLHEVVTLKETHQVDTIALDDIAEIDDVDLIKIDIQGGELDVFRHAERVLKDVVVIQTEVEFIPLYDGQPLFSEIDAYLRSKGFLLHTFLGLAHRSFDPLCNKAQPQGISQVLWTDALFVRDFRDLGQLPASKLAKLALILHDLYRAYDLCYRVLLAYDTVAERSCGPEYLAWLESSGGFINTKAAH